MRNDTKFWDKMASGYAKSAIGDEASYQIKLAKTQEYFTADTEVLEFGCGTGSTAIIHAPHVKHILATDISENMLAIARTKTVEAGIENITYQQTTLEALEAPNAGYNVILGLSILHLLRDRRVAIARAHDLLKPGGVFVSSTICMANRMWWMTPFMTLGRWFGMLPVLRFFTTSQLVRSLTEAGFEIEHHWTPKKSQTAFIVARKV
ncbi:MAG: class I SAM-dependent methyltransferase [Maricaulis sp.]|jgi:2-polyprenyl-3-methyl-5-hydroxy-6-metoxy-1,4-benzoquinol methylase|nr:class I SAM-dependent methyltransferase [Maricaulis sp.]MDG2045309.1 class I SAM-dependent methyltransferase [Maricaulis sp.]